VELKKKAKALFTSSERKGGELGKKKEGTSGINRWHSEGKAFGGSFFFIIQNPPHLGNSKIILEERFWEFT
jgi:hypothetical protein